MMKPKTILLIAVVLIALTVPVVAMEPKFQTGDIIQRRIVPANNAFWKVWSFNQTSGNYTLEPMRAVTWCPFWTPIKGKIQMTWRFIDPRFRLRGHAVMCNG